MRNEHHRHARLFHRAHHIEYALDFDLRKRRRRFVHDNELCVEQKRARNLDDLFIRRVQRAQRRFRIQLDLEPFPNTSFERAIIALRIDSPGFFQLASQKEIFIYVQVIHQTQFLMNERELQHSENPSARRILFSRRQKRISPASGCKTPPRIFIQRRFSGAVFADQRVNLPVANRKIHTSEHLVCTERLIDARHVQCHFDTPLLQA